MSEPNIWVTASIADAMMPLPVGLLRALDEVAFDRDFVDFAEDVAAPLDLAVELVDFELLREEAAFDVVGLALVVLLDVVAFFAEGLPDADFDDEAFDFAPDVFDLDALEAFDEPALLCEGLELLFDDDEERELLDFELEDFLVVAMIVSPLIKRFQNEQLPQCKGHTIKSH